MEPYLFLIRHQFNVTVMMFGTNIYRPVWVCTTLYLWLSYVHFMEQSMVYHLKYRNMCIPSVMVVYSYILISIWLCVEFISNKYRVYRRKYLGLYSYRSILHSINLYNIIFNTSFSSHPTSYVVYCIQCFSSTSYYQLLVCIEQYQYIYGVHWIYSQPFGRNNYKFSHTSHHCIVLHCAHLYYLLVYLGALSFGYYYECILQCQYIPILLPACLYCQYRYSKHLKWTIHYRLLYIFQTHCYSMVQLDWGKVEANWWVGFDW
jgi:hypothetical protein